MKTNLDRIRHDIDELAKISVTQGPGCCRQTYTKEFAEAPVFMCGSHFDTVRTGGRFDGLA